jgi:hypothetical protein
MSSCDSNGFTHVYFHFLILWKYIWIEFASGNGRCVLFCGCGSGSVRACINFVLLDADSHSEEVPMDLEPDPGVIVVLYIT